MTSLCRSFGSKMPEYYQIRPIKIGVEVRGVDLKTENRPAVVKEILKDVTKHRLLVFKDQDVVSGPRHVEISQWFGPLESTFYKHPKSPHPDVFRVSNNEDEGCTGVGRTGWHIDGSFQDCPFSYSLYHMVSIPQRGPTVFAPMTELIARLDEDRLDRWNRLWMMSDRRTGPCHPLIYNHPITQKPVLCFHLGMTSAYVWDKGTNIERIAYPEETVKLSAEIHNEFIRDGGSIQYSHEWQPGDFIISDNLAVAHEAAPETQEPPELVGLRVLHRTTVKGEKRPTKGKIDLDDLHSN